MKDQFFLDIVKKANKSYDLAEFPTTGFIDTGCYALNALLSASIYGGIPNNRSTMWAGDPSTGKTYLTLSCVKAYMDNNPTAGVIYFDTEFAIEEEMLRKRGIDNDRFFILQPDTLQSFRTDALNILDNYEKEDAKTRSSMLLVLDSLGNLPTSKEVEDSMAGSETRDMTKAQIIKSIFRVLTLKMGKNGVPLIICNHTYDSMSQYSPKEISGGSGGKYAASTIVTLSKSKDKDGTDVVGNIIRASTYKSRFSKENQQVQLKLSYSKGLDPYFGLLDIASAGNIIKKVSKQYEMPDGTKEFGKHIYQDPEKYFTKDIMEKIDNYCKVHFGLGMGEDLKEEENALSENTTEESNNE